VTDVTGLFNQRSALIQGDFSNSVPLGLYRLWLKGKGLAVTVEIPARTDTDWNDVWRERRM